MSTHNICFHREIEKYHNILDGKSSLSGSSDDNNGVFVVFIFLEQYAISLTIKIYFKKDVNDNILDIINSQCGPYQ